MNNGNDKFLWYSAGLHFECHKCGQCCSGPTEGYIWVRRPEIQLLANHLSMTPSEFKAKYLRRIGFRMSLREEPRTRDCVFLQETRGSKSCSIYPVRPAQCRSWPFWPSNLSRPDSWNLAAQKCPGINRGIAHTPDQILTKQNTKNWWCNAESHNSFNNGHSRESGNPEAYVFKDIVREVSDIYNWLDVQLESKSPDCGACGRCCDFDSFDHRLFVTSPEIMFFADKIGSQNITSHFIPVIPAKAGIQKLDFNEIPSTKPILTATNRDYEMASKEITSGRCPYQTEGKCTVYPYRFAGCRIFSCKGNPDFQSALTESVIKKFKSLCDEFDVPYRYLDLPSALNTFQERRV